MIGLWEMEEYGYSREGMLPLTKETALELFDHDLPVYQLHEDGSETLIGERKQVTEYEAFSVLKKRIGRMKKACWRFRRNFRGQGK